MAVARIANITNVPFAAGCVRPLVRQIEVAPDIHGDSGMDGPVLPEPAIKLDPRHAVDFIIDTIMSHPTKTVTLVPTGGLTNIAMAARKEPKIVERVKEVVLMGGGITLVIGVRWLNLISKLIQKQHILFLMKNSLLSWLDWI